MSPERRARPGVPYLVRHRMRRTVLPFPEPRVPSGLHGRRLLQRRLRNPCDWSAALPAVRSNHISHSSTFTLRPLARVLVGAIPSADLSTCRRSSTPAFRFSRRRDRQPEKSRLAWWFELALDGRMGVRPFHDVTAAYPLPGPCPKCVRSGQALGTRFRSTRLAGVCSRCFQISLRNR